jgi:hypothetical protein
MEVEVDVDTFNYKRDFNEDFSNIQVDWNWLEFLYRLDQFRL